MSEASRIWHRTKVWLKQRSWARRVDAWLEWIFFGARFRRAEWLDTRGAPPRDGYPLPPPRLRYRVHGSIDRDSFLEVGAKCATDILSALGSQNINPGPNAEILDFGCGCGRVLRHLLRSRPDWRYTGVDIDEEAIGWCRGAYPQATFQATPSKPPTDLADASFDLVIAVSVFTHLDEEYQNAWLEELYRVVRPGGHLLASVRGKDEPRQLPQEDRVRLARDGILHKSWRTGRLKLDGLPAFYQTTYHTREYVERAWAGRFTVAAYLPMAINNHHDAVILRRPEPPE